MLSANPDESFWNLAWSPDSQRLAYGNWGATTSIMSCRLDGTEKTVLQSGGELHQSWTGPLPFVWAADGRLVFSRRERLAAGFDPVTSNVWVVDTDISKGTTVGQPRRLTRGAGSNLRGLSISDDGRTIVAHLVRNQSDLWVGRLDPGGTRFTAEVQLTDDEWPDYPACWSHDSTSLLFTSVRGGAVDVLQVAASGGSAQPIVIGSGHNIWWSSPTFTPDGRHLLYLWSRGAMSRIPMDGGPPIEVMTELHLDEIRCSVSRDARCLAGYRDGHEYVFISFDALSGDTEELLRIDHRPPFTNWSLSPNGKTLAVVHNDDDAIRIFSLPSGRERTIHVAGWLAFEFVSWSADGRRLFVNADFANARHFADLLSVDLEGNATVLRSAPSQWHVRPVASPDGEHLAFASMPFHGNAWLITGFS
jgi:Tol biopolymer transport system component